MCKYIYKSRFHDLSNFFNCFNFSVLCLEHIKSQELTFLPEYYLITGIFCLILFASKDEFTFHFKFQYKNVQVIFLSVFILTCYLLLLSQERYFCEVSFNNSIIHDSLAVVSKFIIGLSTIVYLLFIGYYLEFNKLTNFEYCILILTSVFGFFLLCSSNDFLTVYLSLELQGLAFYVLAAFQKSSTFSIESGIKYFVLGSLSTALFLLGVTFVYGFSGSLVLTDYNDFFIWVFSTNSFFLSFESVSRALESFHVQDDTNLERISDSFTVLKSKSSLSMFDLKLLLTQIFPLISADCDSLSEKMLLQYYQMNYTQSIHPDQLQPNFSISSLCHLKVAYDLQTALVEFIQDRLMPQEDYLNFTNSIVQATYYEDIGTDFYLELVESESISIRFSNLFSSLDCQNFFHLQLQDRYQSLKAFKLLVQAEINKLDPCGNEVGLNRYFSHSKKLSCDNYMNLLEPSLQDMLSEMEEVEADLKTRAIALQVTNLLVTPEDIDEMWFPLFLYEYSHLESELLKDIASFQSTRVYLEIWSEMLQSAKESCEFHHRMNEALEPKSFQPKHRFMGLHAFVQLHIILIRIDSELEILDQVFKGRDFSQTLLEFQPLLQPLIEFQPDMFSVMSIISLNSSLNTPVQEFNTHDFDLIILGMLLILLSLLLKLALAPFHLWSPDVYEGSPTSSTFFFMVLSKLGIFVLLFRICYSSFYSFISYWQFYSIMIATVSIFIGAVAGLKQRKLKSLLTYSSINNMGFVLLAFSAGTFEGIQIKFYYLIVYMITSISLFGIILNLRFKYSEKQNRDLGDLALLQESNNVIAQNLALTLFSMAGLPPLVGFLAKLVIFKALIGVSLYFVSVINIFFSVIATFYYLRIVKIIYFENLLVGNLYARIHSNQVFVLNLLTFSLVFFFLKPTFLYLYSYKITLFLNKNFY